MKNTFMAGIALAGILSWSSGAEASSFTGFSETGDVFFNDFADFDYDPFFLGGAVFDFFGLVNIALAPDLGAGSLLLTDDFLAEVLVGALVDTALHADGGASDDSFSMLFDLTTGTVRLVLSPTDPDDLVFTEEGDQAFVMLEDEALDVQAVQWWRKAAHLGGPARSATS